MIEASKKQLDFIEGLGRDLGMTNPSYFDVIRKTTIVISGTFVPSIKASAAIKELLEMKKNGVILENPDSRAKAMIYPHIDGGFIIVSSLGSEIKRAESQEALIEEFKNEFNVIVHSSIWE